MKKTTLLMLTLFLSVFAFAQEIEQVPLPGLKKQPSLKQQVLMAKREGKQLNKETIAQFKMKKKPATSELAKVKKQHNFPVQKKVDAAKVAKVAQSKAQNGSQQGVPFAAKTDGTSLVKWDWAAHQTPQFVSKSGMRAPKLKAVTDPVAVRMELTGVKPTVVTGSRRIQGDHTAIITSIPATAEVKYYSRSGSYYDDNNSYAVSVQSGIATIAFDGNDVYIKNPIAGYDSGSWIRGTKNGNTITFPLGQFLYWNGDNGYGLYITMANLSGSSWSNETTAAEITYTIDGNTITQNGTSAEHTFVVAWSDDDTVFAYGSPGGEFGTVFTLDESYVPTPTVLVELPAGAEVEDWYAEGTTNSGSVPVNVKVAFVGNEVYVAGLNAEFPDSWIKGTIEGTTVTFSGLQYVGEYGAYHIWVVGVEPQTGVLQDFTMIYDAEAKTLTLDPTSFIVYNASDTKMYYLSYISELTISAEQPAPAKIDVLPYTNNFDDAAAQADFRIIDANEDGRTFVWYSGMARYTYNSYAQADDWLVSPQIYLEAGKKYGFSISAHAQATAYPERFEVKAAKSEGVAPTAAQMAAGAEVIAATDVTSAQFVTYSNNEFTVAESGYYFIGVHAISDADEWYLYIDDFSIDLARVVPPTELTSENWFFAGYFYDGGETDIPVEKPLAIGISGSDVYVQGISYYLPEAWIKGTLSEDHKSITFASGQYYGAYYDQYPMWFAAAAVSADGQSLELLPSVTAAFDAEKGTVTLPEGVYILENSEEDVVYMYGYYTEILPIIKGGAPAVNEVPVGLLTTEWSLKSQSYVEDEDTGEAGYEEYNYHVQVGFAENDVYILGLVESLSDAVVKGTLDTETNKITFPAGQCIGVDYDIDWDNWVLIEIPVYFTGFGENGMEDVVMTYDPATKTMTMDNNFMLVNNNWLLLNPAVIQRDVTITAIPDVAAVPAQPEIVWANFDTSWYPYVEMEVPQIAADGSEILSDKLFYQYWIEVDGVQTPLTLDPAEYTELTEPMTEIPVNFSDEWDIYPDHLYLNQDFSQWKKIGIQSIYYGGGEKKTSEIAWKTIVNFSVDEAFDNTKGEFDVQPKALEGEQVFLNINPNNGYKIAKATARVGKTPIKVDAETDEYGTTYSVIAPPADVIVNAEFEVTAADFDVEIAAGTAEAPANINEALDTQLAGMIVRNLNITLQAGEYTMTAPIVAAGSLNINGNNAVIDASAIVGGEDGASSAPFIQMSTEPQVEFNAKPDGSLTDYYGVAQIALRDLTVKGLKNSIFWDANTKYCVGELLVDNCYFQLATEAVQNEALFAFEAGGAKDLNFRNNTFVGNNAVARFFVRYNNSARLDRYGYDVATDYMVMGYVNNTFVNLLQPKNEKGDESQWANGNGVQGYARAAFNVVKNIWWNCGKNIARRLGFGRFNGNNPVTFESNTYFNEGVDESAGEVNYDQSGTILTSDPKFEDAANNDFSVRTKSDQALNQAGDWNRWGEWIVDVYDITIDIANEANGTVKAPKNAVEGEIITLEAIPTEGYRLVEGSLKVMLGKSEIVLTDNTFSMPAANVTVKAEFELIPVFAITIAEGIENGTVVADKTEAAEGDVVTLTITPNEGYELDYVVVTGVNSNISVPVEDGKFIMPADAVTVNAAFKADATGIIAVKADDLENAVIYNLQGVRVDKARKGGVYIVNGKKVAIK